MGLFLSQSHHTLAILRMPTLFVKELCQKNEPIGGLMQIFGMENVCC
jgi:hypothetical protein